MAMFEEPNARDPVTGRRQWLGRFLLIMGSQVFSLVGSNAGQFALMWWLTVRTGSAAVLAIAGSAGFLAPLLLSPLAGVWIDRASRKRVMIAADLYVALCALILLVWFLATPNVPVWVVLVMIGLRAIGGVFHTPAWSALLPALVPEKLLDRVAGWNQFLVGGANILGPVLGGLLVAISLAAALGVDIIGAILACLILTVIPMPKKTAPSGQSIGHDLREGLRLIFADRFLKRLALPMLAAVLFFLPIGSLFPLMTSRYFGRTAWQTSLVAAAFGAGLLLASLLTGILGLRHKTALVFGSIILLGSALLLSGLLPAGAYAWFVALAAIAGFCGSLAVLVLFVHIQKTFPQAVLGRVFAVVFSISALATPVGLFLAAPFAEAYGINTWFIIAGASVILAGFGGLLASRLRRS